MQLNWNTRKEIQITFAMKSSYNTQKGVVQMACLERNLPHVTKYQKKGKRLVQ